MDQSHQTFSPAATWCGCILMRSRHFKSCTLGAHYHVTPWTHWTNRSFIYLFVFDVGLYKSVALGFIFMTWILSTSCDVMVLTNDIVGSHVQLAKIKAWNAFKCFYWEKTGLVTEATGWTKPSSARRDDVHLKLWNIEFHISSPYNLPINYFHSKMGHFYSLAIFCTHCL